MDWFERWPKEALVAVSNHFLTNYDIVCSPQVKQAIVQTMGDFQVNGKYLDLEVFHVNIIQSEVPSICEWKVDFLKQTNSIE
jgi:hypothetical protein